MKTSPPLQYYSDRPRRALFPDDDDDDDQGQKKERG